MWAIGYVERPGVEYQLYRYRSLESAGMALAELMAIKGPYNYRGLSLVTRFLIWLEEQREEDFEATEKALAFCELDNIMFVLGRFDAIAGTPVQKQAPYRIVQDHRDCKPGFCFGDIAERN